MGKAALAWLSRRRVTLAFALLCAGAAAASGQSPEFLLGELFARGARNSFLVLSLVIPVAAGLGLNFGVVLGAMAAQLALFAALCLGLSGAWGFLLAALLSTPVSALLGWLTGRFYNRIRGSEMIGGLVLGYFADGFYQLAFLYLAGGVFPIPGPGRRYLLSSGVGVRGTIDLAGSFRYALDGVSLGALALLGAAGLLLGALLPLLAPGEGRGRPWGRSAFLAAAGAGLLVLRRLPGLRWLFSGSRVLLLWAVEGAALFLLLSQGGRWLRCRLRGERPDPRRPLALSAAALTLYGATWLPPVYRLLTAVRLPAATWLAVAGGCLAERLLFRTRLGQGIRAAGQSPQAATAAGIDADGARTAAMVLSTVLAGWGQLIFLQGLGTFSTYGAHTQAGQFAIAALLVGGASVRRAGSGQAILGVFLFHALFLTAPLAGRELFGSAMVGEYFRVFLSYAVIAAALVLHGRGRAPGTGQKKAPGRQ